MKKIFSRLRDFFARVLKDREWRLHAASRAGMAVLSSAVFTAMMYGVPSYIIAYLSFSAVMIAEVMTEVTYTEGEDASRQYRIAKDKITACVCGCLAGIGIYMMLAGLVSWVR